MITKILFTLLIVVGVYVVTTYRRAANAPRPRPRAKAPRPVAQDKTIRLALWLFVFMTVLSGLIYAWWEWQAAHQILDIRVIGSGGEVATYRAYKADVRGRRFATLDGRQVTIADSERIEITEAR
jgi:uncharacterized iron-regulated membrane protein